MVGNIVRAVGGAICETVNHTHNGTHKQLGRRDRCHHLGFQCSLLLTAEGVKKLRQNFPRNLAVCETAALGTHAHSCTHPFPCTHPPPELTAVESCFPGPFENHVARESSPPPVPTPCRLWFRWPDPAGGSVLCHVVQLAFLPPAERLVCPLLKAGSWPLISWDF